MFKATCETNGAIGASAPVVDPVVERSGGVAIRRGSLKSLLLDTEQTEPHPERSKDTQTHNQKE